ncbi:tetratricopeptide repeat protein [Bradyrhizobium sp. AT1]|uniref:tetratricopeptide repeat protein n=1 Tax=Bradyrhizobium sp. AT1 TaxID=574934 RepID=UPI0018DB8B47|nr:tetratricopeptide repeat protein [Bradyrhizobium sp. AT1]
MSQPKNYSAIMLSSTFTDLKEHRQNAIDIINRFDLKPKVMEHSGAQADTDVIDTSLKMVRDAAAYVLVIGRKYGQTPRDPVRNPNGLSITELEFNEAMALGRPILLFIMSDQHPLTEADFEFDPEKRAKLAAFRERAKLMYRNCEVHRIYEIFDSMGKFSTSAAIAIAGLVRHLPAQGKPGPAIDNVPFRELRNFLGRDDDLAAIDTAFKTGSGRAAVSALHGLRGVGKTTLAAAYAERRRTNYRATWWIRAGTEHTIRADLVGLGVQLGWVVDDAAEDPAIKAVLQRLRIDGNGILLIYDNAIGRNELTEFLPRGGASHIIITSNAPDWRGIADPVEIAVWPKEIGADFLIARTGRVSERAEALALSHALGGLPLAHEQASAYCDRVGLPFREYIARFEVTSVEFLDKAEDAPRDYRLTVAKTFEIAMAEAASRQAVSYFFLLVAASLAAQPIPTHFFFEWREKVEGAFAANIKDVDLDDVIGTLRAFALIDRRSIRDERDLSVWTDCISVHPLIGRIALARIGMDLLNEIRWESIRAMALIFPAGDVLSNPDSWPRARRLDVIASSLVRCDTLPQEAEAGNWRSIIAASMITVLNQLALYRQTVLGSYEEAQRNFEVALLLSVRELLADNPFEGVIQNNLGRMYQDLGNVSEARSCFELAASFYETRGEPNSPALKTVLTNLGSILTQAGDYANAQLSFERASTIADDCTTVSSGIALLNQLAILKWKRGERDAGLADLERSVESCKKMFPPNHPYMAATIASLGGIVLEQGDLARADELIRNALAIRETVLGPDHPDTALSLYDLGLLLEEGKDLVGARPCYERALTIFEQKFGPAHPRARNIAEKLVALLDRLDASDRAAAVRQRFKL